MSELGTPSYIYIKFKADAWMPPQSDAENWPAARIADRSPRLYFERPVRRLCCRRLSPPLSLLGGGLLLFGEVDALTLEHVQQRLGRLEDLLVSPLRLRDGLVVLCARRNLACQVVIDAR